MQDWVGGAVTAWRMFGEGEINAWNIFVRRKHLQAPVELRPPACKGSTLLTNEVKACWTMFGWSLPQDCCRTSNKSTTTSSAYSSTTVQAILEQDKILNLLSN